MCGIRRSMAQPDHYLLGRGEAEEARLKRQIADLAPDSDAQLEKIGIKPGERLLDLGAVRAGSCISWVSGSVPPVPFLGSSGARILSAWRAASSRITRCRRSRFARVMPITRDCRERRSTVPICGLSSSTYRSLNALSTKWYPSYALVAGWRASRRTRQSHLRSAVARVEPTARRLQGLFVRARDRPLCRPTHPPSISCRGSGRHSC